MSRESTENNGTPEILRGTVVEGVVVLEEGRSLPEGTRVKIIPHRSEEASDSAYSSLLELAGTVDDLPPDMARNHDHYLHGTV